MRPYPDPRATAGPPRCDDIQAAARYWLADVPAASHKPVGVLASRLGRWGTSAGLFGLDCKRRAMNSWRATPRPSQVERSAPAPGRWLYRRAGLQPPVRSPDAQV